MSTPRGTKRSLNVPCTVLQHVRGYDSQGKRSPPRANTEPHPCNETAPMQRKHLTAPQHVPGHVPGHATVPLRSPARPRARNRPQPFPAPCRSTWAATIHEGNIPRAVLAKKEIASTQRNCAHATNPPKPLPSTSPGKNPAPTVPRAVPQHVSSYDIQWKRSPPRANTEPHSCNETAPMQRKHLTAPQHVPGHDTSPNCSPRHATARGRPRNAGETFPGAC